MRRFTITPDLRKLATRNAKAAEIGGRSRLRKRAARAEALSVDQRVGQYGEMFGSIHFTGSIDHYVAHRARCNANPTKGDGGTDLPGGIDMKCSLMRRAQTPSLYNLPVRPDERGPGKTYALALVDLAETSVWLVGTITDERLGAIGRTDPRFGDALVAGFHELDPCVDPDPPRRSMGDIERAWRKRNGYAPQWVNP